jgi:Zn-dependent protease
LPPNKNLFKPALFLVALMRISTSKTEVMHLLRAWIAISLAFSILFGGLASVQNFIVTFLIAGFTVGLGFLFHELAHKVLAQRYGCFAEFRAFDSMLILAILMSFLGFIIAAPGAVMISGRVSKKANGLISSAGISTNIVLACLFLLSGFVFGYNLVSFLGAYINSLLAAFNLIPVWHFDGSKVLAWNKLVYAVMAVLALGLFFATPIIFSAIGG